ncbi:MAG: nitrous oxide reductase accessory protein NosL [Nitrospirales bacterium]|nr:nitrous oxide reductase accessory protein NosL [Nitrospirales bacterium]
MRRTITFLVAALLIASVGFAGEKKPVAPTQQDKCPVCGMFVAKYKDWVAQIIFKNGTYHVFDGTKDMLRYYQDMKKYTPGKKTTDIDAIYVTDYYALSPVAAQSAYFVLGSDVYGPMGKELIPFSREEEAKEFMKDHKGQRILRFKDITPAILDNM